MLTTAASVIHLDESNFDQTISDAKVPVLVDFWASWCAPCRMMAPVLDQIASEHGEKVLVAKVDVDLLHKFDQTFSVTPMSSRSSSSS